jgi:hypothetical protein
MKSYQIAITITDVTEVGAKSEEEAYQIARDIFTESGYFDTSNNAELDIIGISELQGD